MKDRKYSIAIAPKRPTDNIQTIESHRKPLPSMSKSGSEEIPCKKWFKHHLKHHHSK